MRKNSINMCEGPLFKKMVLFTIPIMMTGVLQLLFNAADLIVVGQFCGSESVAAVGATSALTNLMVNFFIGLSTGTGVAVAQAIGAQSDKDISLTVHTAIPTAIISGLAVSVIGVAFSRSMLVLMGVPENILPLSALYMKIYFCGMIFNMVYNFGASILRAAGDSKSPLIFLTLAGVINVILNVIFVKNFDMNVAGVALATTVSQAISAVLVVITLMKRTDSCKLKISKLRIKKRPLLKIMAIGVPSGIQSTLFSLSNVIIQSSVNSFGDVVMSGSSAAASIEGFLYIILNAFHHTSLNFSGQNAGAGKYGRVRKTFFICVASVTAVGVVLGMVFYALGRPLLSIYLPDSPESIEYGIIRMTYIMLPYFLCGLMEVATGCIRGMGSSFATMVITIIGVCGFRIAWIYTVFQTEQFHSLDGLFVSYPISWFLSFAAQVVAFYIVYKKNKRLLLRLDCSKPN